MTAALAARDSGRRIWDVVDTTAPAQRLAALRIAVGAFTVVYLLVRLPVFLQLADRRSGFDGVGVASPLSGPVPDGVVQAVVVATLLAGVAAVVGWRYAVSGPAFALGVLALTSYRGSWGQLLHFENLFTIHLVILAFAPASVAWSLDARRRHPAPRTEDGRPVAGAAAGSAGTSDPGDVRFGWPISLLAVAVVVTYVIAGVAKLRYGGVDWVVGDSLRNHVAYAAARNELVGVPAAPLAGLAVRLEAVWPFLAAATIVVEIGAPMALFGGRWRTVWVLAAWAMHVGVLLTMRIGFPYPLFLVAFLPFFRVERLWTDAAGPLVRKVIDRRAPSRAD